MRSGGDGGGGGGGGGDTAAGRRRPGSKMELEFVCSRVLRKEGGEEGMQILILGRWFVRTRRRSLSFSLFFFTLFCILFFSFFN